MSLFNFVFDDHCAFRRVEKVSLALLFNFRHLNIKCDFKKRLTSAFAIIQESLPLLSHTPQTGIFGGLRFWTAQITRSRWKISFPLIPANHDPKGNTNITITPVIKAAKN